MARWIGKSAAPALVAAAASLLLSALATTTFAAEPANDSVQRATYQTGPSYPPAAGSTPATNQNPLNPPELMPLDPSGRNSAETASAGQRGHRSTPAAPSSLPAILTMFGSLAVVLGLFLGLTWFLRRGLPLGTRQLSGEVVEVLGRAPLAPRQQMHVIRFGNRLLLVSVTAGGAETLAEITDPVEVDRLAGICQQNHAHSATNSFRQIFWQLSEGRGGRDIRSTKTNGNAVASAKSNRSTAAEDDDV